MLGVARRGPLGSTRAAACRVQRTRGGWRQPDASSGADGSEGDNVYLLEGPEWKKYWYQSGFNASVTKVATASAKSGTGGGSKGELPTFVIRIYLIKDETIRTVDRRIDHILEIITSISTGNVKDLFFDISVEHQLSLK